MILKINSMQIDIKSPKILFKNKLQQIYNFFENVLFIFYKSKLKNDKLFLTENAILVTEFNKPRVINRNITLSHRDYTVTTTLRS